jgi:predicted nuclease of predicted toxin-antitoxin system
LKLLVDENLPPRLVDDLADLFPDSAHVGPLGLGSTPDALIWEYAKEHGLTFLTKDKDFANLSLASGAPPKVILLQTGNCSTDRLLGILRSNAIRLADFENDTRRSLLVLR